VPTSAACFGGQRSFEAIAPAGKGWVSASASTRIALDRERCGKPGCLSAVPRRPVTAATDYRWFPTRRDGWLDGTVARAIVCDYWTRQEVQGMAKAR